MSNIIAVLERGTSLRKFRQHHSKFNKIYLVNPFNQEISQIGVECFQGKELVHVVSGGTDCRLHQRQYNLFSKLTIIGNAMHKRAFPIKYYRFQPLPEFMKKRGFPLVGCDSMLAILNNQPNITHDDLIEQLNTEHADAIAVRNAKATASIRYWPTTGMFAIDLALMSEKPTEIHLFGFDFFINGSNSYFIGKKKSHQTKNAQDVMKYYLKKLVKEFPDTTFYSAYDLPDMQEPNWNVIK